MGDQPDLLRAGLAPDQIGEREQAFRRDREGCKEWRSAERVRRGIVEAVNPDRLNGLRAVSHAGEIRLLAAVHQDPVVLVFHRPYQRPLELVELWIPVPVHPHMGDAGVKAVERVIGGAVDSRRAPGESPP